LWVHWTISRLRGQLMKISFAMTYDIDIHHKKEIVEYKFNKLRISITKHT